MTLLNKSLGYCSDLSLQADEPLYGTALQTQIYLLLEVDANWGAKALEESALPQPVKARLDDLSRQIPGLKTLLIKPHPRQRQPMGVRFFVAILSLLPPRLYEFQLDSHAGLLDLDIPAILAGDALYESHRREAPLYLVCTNGRRDLCCAHYGLPVFNALAATAPSSPQPLVWQSSHVGGHRFAPNLLCLPHGLMYGRVGVNTALAILEADREGRMVLASVRGRVSDPPVVQAAEYFLRQKNLQDRLDFCRLVAVQQGSPGEWLVQFRIYPADTLLSVGVSMEVSQEQVFESCSLDKTTSVTRYKFQMIDS